MPAAIDLTGRRFGRLIVIQREESKTKYRSQNWECKCDCGNKVTVLTGNLRRGFTQSCGCLHKEIMTDHGLSHLPEYVNWERMRDRCYNPSHRSYHRYGGRGITMSEEWRTSFETFYKDMGPRPSPAHSIDREKNDQGYCKENCRWATAIEQANNKSNNVFHQYRGVSKTLPTWCRELNLNYFTMRSRVQSGLSFEEALRKENK